MDEVSQYIIDLLSRVEAGLIGVAPEALEIVLGVTRLDGLFSVLLGFALLGLAVLASKSSQILFKKSGEVNDSETASAFMFGSIFAGIGALCSGAVALLNLLDFWNWFAIFAPELALAKQMIGVVLQ
jgi:hypothetical protein